MSRIRIVALALAGLAASIAFPRDVRAATHVTVPLECSKGPSGQHFDAFVTMPTKVASGGIVIVRIDGMTSAKLSQTGLNFIHDMTSEYLVPAGTTYVEGSAKIIPDTGTENVRDGATVTHDNGVIRLKLPAQVKEGTSYAPPSFEVQFKVTAAPGATVAFPFQQFRVTANAFVVGDIRVRCDPTPKPFTLGKTAVVASPLPVSAIARPVRIPAPRARPGARAPRATGRVRNPR